MSQQQRLFYCVWVTALLMGQTTTELAIRMNVDLIVLQATVRDAKGEVAGELVENNFAVFEGGEKQRIRVFRHEDLAVTAGLVVDHSGSMRGWLDEVAQAAKVFVQTSHPEDEMFVVNFNDGVSMGLKQGLAFSNRKEELAAAIERVPAEGQTALYDGIAHALRHLEGGSREKKVLLVVSDGEDTASVSSLNQVMQLAIRSNATIYAIGLFEAEASDQSERVLRKLTKATGGELYVPTRRMPVGAICERIAAEIRRQYTIGYFASRPAAAGAYREVKLSAQAEGMGKLTVRTRAGYFAGGTP